MEALFQGKKKQRPKVGRVCYNLHLNVPRPLCGRLGPQLCVLGGLLVSRLRPQRQLEGVGYVPVAHSF